MKSEQAQALRALLLKLERQLMDPVFRKDRAGVAALLAEEFFEIGSSGRVWTRETIVDLLACESSQAAPRVEEFALQQIAPHAVLVTYRAVREESAGALQSGLRSSVLRSSVWVRRGDRWQILFHQGTKVPSEKLLAECVDVAANAAGQDLHADAEEDE
jgi:hypothetical protein